MVRASAWSALWLLGLGAACGGESRGGPATNAGTSGAGRASAGAGSGVNGGAGMGGSGMAAGMGGSGAAAACEHVPSPSYAACAPSCATRVDSHSQMICVDGAWGCNAGEVGVWECPPDSCTRASDHECCKLDDGHRTPVTCSPEGPVEPCPDGSVNLQPHTLCVAAAIHVQSCHELEDQPCSRIGDRCGYVRACSEYCECEAFPNGSRWSCIVPVC
jgi:hypothetical protein